jgi:hypothetical protein
MVNSVCAHAHGLACIQAQIHVCMYVCMYTISYYIYIHTYTYVLIYTYILLRTQTHLYTYACIHTCMHAYIHTYVHTYIHMYIHTYTYIHTYIHAHIYVYTHTRACTHTCKYTLTHMQIMRTGSLLHHYNCGDNDGVPIQTSYSKDSQLFTILCVDEVQVRHTRTGELKHTLKIEAASVDLNEDGSLLVSGECSDDQVEGQCDIKVWQLHGGVSLVRTMTHHGDYVRDVKFAPDCSRIASACGDGACVIWNARSGERLAVLNSTDTDTDVDYLAWSPCGSLLAGAGCRGRELYVWNVVCLWKADANGGAPVWPYVCVYLCVYVCMCVCMCVCTYECIACGMRMRQKERHHAYIYMCMCVCVYVGMYVYMCVQKCKLLNIDACVDDRRVC